MKVKIKTWAEMFDEFGGNNDEGLNCKYTFVTQMEEAMPEDRIIDIQVYDSGYMEWQGWNISDDMIEEWLDGSETPHDIKECLEAIEESLYTLRIRLKSCGII